MLQSIPRSARTPVWALPLSLAATNRIDVSFSSSPYLDVSVQEVPDLYLCIQYRTTEVCSARFPHSEICGSLNICFLPQLIAAYHVFHRLLVPRHPPYALTCLTKTRIVFSYYSSRVHSVAHSLVAGISWFFLVCFYYWIFYLSKPIAPYYVLSQSPDSFAFALSCYMLIRLCRPMSMSHSVQARLSPVHCPSFNIKYHLGCLVKYL